MVNFERKETYSLQDLIEILRILRAPAAAHGIARSTHLSDRRNFLEEAYEAAEAFDRDDPRPHVRGAGRYAHAGPLQHPH